MNNPGAGLTAWLPSRQAGTALPPVVAFGTGIAALFAAGAGWQNAFRWWQRLDGASRALLTVAVAVGLFLLTTAVMLLLPTLTRVYEGNWGKGWPGGRLRSAAARREEARFQRLLHADSERAYAKRYLSFPPRQADIRPTRLGNVLGAAEEYPGDPRRYGVDAVFFWPRLYPLLPDGMRASLAAARSTMETLLLTSALSLLFTVTALAAGAAGATSLAVAGIGAASGLAASLAAYRLAVRAAMDYGELVRSSFDVYRRDLLKAMGFPLPETLEEEREVWEAIGQQLYRRAADHEEYLRLRPDP
jgi:hypothetical protein